VIPLILSPREDTESVTNLVQAKMAWSARQDGQRKIAGSAPQQLAEPGLPKYMAEWACLGN
jgi:hypothetical protein